jgi:hypothetical protein
VVVYVFGRYRMEVDDVLRRGDEELYLGRLEGGHRVSVVEQHVEARRSGGESCE